MIQVLTNESQRLIRKTFSRYGTKAACIRATGLTKEVMNNLIQNGKGKAETIETVSTYIGRKLEVDEYSIKATA